jgi:hypothetical protein
LLPGDVNKNNIINALDLATINLNLSVGASQETFVIGDVNRDGVINSFEQAVLIRHAGKH